MEPKVIVLEGPDSGGKSTQAKMLLKYLLDKPTYVIHFSNISGITSEQSREYSYKLYNDAFVMMQEAYSNNRNLIFDRCHIGEYVYSPIYRDYSGDFIFEIENKFKNKNFFKNVYLFLFEDLIENLIKRDDGHSFSTEPDVKIRELKLFKEAFEKSHIHHKFIVNIFNSPKEEVNDFIVKALGI